jgi:DNA mismatch endonuclease Vsr
MPDNLTPEQRRYTMTRVKSKDTGLEKIVRSELHRRGFRFRKHVRDLPGSPDAVFVKAKVAVFIDGDFWHGYKFSNWEHKLQVYWREKIKRNIARDRRNHAKLRRMGWRVIRIWQHDVKQDLDKCIRNVIAALASDHKVPSTNVKVTKLKMSESTMNPSLFGLQHSNRDFTQRDSWGKNQFNSSFPASLACYMGTKKIDPVYLRLDENFKVKHSKISVEELFGMKELSSNLFFSFETTDNTYAPLLLGDTPRADLVTLDTSPDQPRNLRALEVKLTALPDNTTCNLSEDLYGSEVVVRPDSIVYLALSIADFYKRMSGEADLEAELEPVCEPIEDWTEIEEIRPRIGKMAKALETIMQRKLDAQSPFLIQPIWKTKGKSGILAEQCLDLFVWSDLGFTQLFFGAGRRERKTGITRHGRSIVWLTKMLYDFAIEGQFNGKSTIDKYTYNTKNDKAFASSGTVTNSMMQCVELTTPRVNKRAFKDIILGGGQNYLSPERRLDAAILNTPGLFDREQISEVEAQELSEE